MLIDAAPWITVISAILIAFLISIAVTPAVKSFAAKVGAIDVPDHKRHIHDHPIPRMGGLAIFFGFLLSVLLGWLAIPITILWIVGITNSVNLIDGLDGLAVGVSTISCITILVVALRVAEPNVAILVAALAGACIGFMPYNLNPAKIFMGDTGSLLLGYVLSTVSVLGLFKFYTVVTFVVPVLALAVPLSDTLFAFVRRIVHGQSPFQADRGHFHHKLMDRR